MGKSFFIYFLLFFSFSIANAYNTQGNSLRSDCFKYKSTLNFETLDTVKINIPFLNDLVIESSWTLIPYKVYDYLKPKDVNFKIISSSSSWEKKFLNDGNLNTSFDFSDIDDDKFIIIDLGKLYPANSLNIYFNAKYSLFYPEFFISSDNINFYKVNRSDLEKFSFRYLKIDFYRSSFDSRLDKVSINELSFKEKWWIQILINPISNKASFYFLYDCKKDEINFVVFKDKYDKLIDEANRNNIYSIDINSKTYTLELSLNNEYNNDFDKDWILNDFDNCKYISNQDQKDVDADLVGDACDLNNEVKDPFQKDSDNDKIRDYDDNCPFISNPDQKDSNANKIWDACEDLDYDGVYFKDDNCPYKWNPKQLDSDNDKIWNECDEKDDRFIESNKIFFISLLVGIIIIFIILMWIMIRKLNTKN